MKYVTLPDEKVRRLSFYLAMEEFVARYLGEPDAFFMWQVAPSVIFGRHQVAANEVNLDYCRANGIQVYRRKSGGGCVYADEGNLMLSMIVGGENVGLAFNRFVTQVLLVLRKAGVAAVGTSHNDIMTGGQKICGTACYHLAGKSIVHSTMLYDTIMAHMQQAITPSREKLARKGVESVRQRVTLLKDHTTLSLDALKSLIRSTLTQGEVALTAAQVAEIERMEHDYLTDEFLKL